MGFRSGKCPYCHSPRPTPGASALLPEHMIRAEYVQNMVRSGLTAQDILDGVRLAHQDYIALVRLAMLGLQISFHADSDENTDKLYET